MELKKINEVKEEEVQHGKKRLINESIVCQCLAVIT